MALGDRLKESRDFAGLTQEKAAEAVGVSRSSMNMYERGERDPDTNTLSALAHLYGVSTDYLLGRTDDPTPPTTGNRKLTPDEQLAQMGVWMRGMGATEDDVRIIKELLDRRKELVRRAKGENTNDISKNRKNIRL